MNISEKIEAALASRGELKKEAGRAGRSRWTRTFQAQRSPEGKLLAAEGDRFWFVGVNGSLRVGATFRISKRVRDDAKAALVAEGERVSK